MCLAIRNFVERDEHGKDAKKISATELCDSPLRRILKLKYWDSVTVDYSDYLWALLGSAVHFVLSLNKQSEVLTEHGCSIEGSNGYVLTMRPDRVNTKTKTLEDYKITSIWTFIHKKHEKEWEEQLNVYRLGLALKGIEVNHAYINAILRDHSKIKYIQEFARGNREYPEIPFKKVPVKLWTFDVAKSFLNNRFILHTKTPMDETKCEPCTARERWYHISQYAVMKEGAKRSTKNFDIPNMDEAPAVLKEVKKYMAEKGYSEPKYTIETRDEESTRCKYYCDFTNFCPYYKKFVPEGQ